MSSKRRILVDGVWYIEDDDQKINGPRWHCIVNGFIGEYQTACFYYLKEETALEMTLVNIYNTGEWIKLRHTTDTALYINTNEGMKKRMQETLGVETTEEYIDFLELLQREGYIDIEQLANEEQ